MVLSGKMLCCLILASCLLACQSGSRQADENIQQTSQQMDSSNNKGSFGYDLAFLKERDRVLVLKNHAGTGKLIVSPKYQAKVFTSTAEGDAGRSFGWINYEAFDKKEEHMNAYGGEDRLWLGPEGGKFSLFFKPGSTMEFANWYTPAAIDTEAWTLDASSDRTAQMSKETTIINYAGTKLHIQLKRVIEVLENEEIEQALQISLKETLKTVGFKTMNTLTNGGNTAWDQHTGAPCLWSLDMFTPSPGTVIIIPYQAQGQGKVATTDYFGEISKERIAYKNGVLLFKADGTSRGKLGIPPHRVKPVAGSYAADTKVLTITLFDMDPKAIYLNQEWTLDKDPFKGDAMNAYNDGPLADGSQMGPFYEIESVSPAAFLQPKASITHQHAVFHFTGDEMALDEIAQKVLGISLKETQF